MLLLAGLALAIEGRVVDSVSGAPVEAEVVVDGQVHLTQADGRFDLALPPGTVVVVRALGYSAVTLPVPEADQWRVRLAPDASFEVVVEARRDAPVVSQTALDRERVLRTPGTFEDPVRLVQSLPGVALTPEYSPSAGDVALRGAGPGESRFLLDGVELPYLFHFNGYSSVFHSRMLDELVLWPSTYGAAWGQATGGIIETKSRWDRPVAPSGSVNVNLVMGGAEATVPIGDRWTVRASGRRSYLDAVNRDDEQYVVFPTFWDWFGRAEFAPGEGRRWALTTFGAGDAYTRYSGEPTELVGWEQETNPLFDYEQSFRVVALSHTERVGRTRADGLVAFIDSTVEGSLPDAVDRQASRTLQLREDLVTAPIEHLALAYGLEARGSDTEIHAATSRAWPEVARESELLGRGVSADADVLRLLGGAYAEARVELGPVRLVPGGRVDADTLTGRLTGDGRVLARWEIGPDTRLRVAGGSYSQFPTVVQTLPDVGAPGVGPARSLQAAIGGDHAFAGRLEVGVDAWAKRMSGLVDTLPTGELVAGVDGEAWGVEVTSRYRLRDVFFTGVAFSFGHATRDGVTFDYDQPWAANLVASWTFAPGWNAGLRYRASAGLPYTPVEDGLYLAASDTYAPMYGERNSARYPMYQKLDLHLEKGWHLRNVKVTAYGETWWVPSGSNVMYRAYRYDYDDSAPVVGPGFVPLVGIRAER